MGGGDGGRELGNSLPKIPHSKNCWKKKMGQGEPWGKKVKQVFSTVNILIFDV